MMLQRPQSFHKKAEALGHFSLSDFSLREAELNLECLEMAARADHFRIRDIQKGIYRCVIIYIYILCIRDIEKQSKRYIEIYRYRVRYIEISLWKE